MNRPALASDRALWIDYTESLEKEIAALKAVERRKTVRAKRPAQQLKQAIALVRSAGMKHGFGGGVAFTAAEYLAGIEQRACV